MSSVGSEAFFVGLVYLFRYLRIFTILFSHCPQIAKASQGGQCLFKTKYALMQSSITHVCTVPEHVQNGCACRVIDLRPISYLEHWHEGTYKIHLRNRKNFKHFFISTLLSGSMGNSRKYPYHTMDGLHINTPPGLPNFQNVLFPHALGIP